MEDKEGAMGATDATTQAQNDETVPKPPESTDHKIWVSLVYLCNYTYTTV